MTQRIIINKNTDIYNYPNEFEDNLGSVTVGDLHGNSVKLLHILFRHKFIQFKDEVTDVHKTYLQFVTTYEEYGELVQEYMENRTILELLNIKENNTKDALNLVTRKIAGYELNTANNEEFFALTKNFETLTQTLEQVRVDKIAIEQKNAEQKEKLRQLVIQFYQFIDMIRCIDNKSLFRLIGDEVSDRGFCDFFTLGLLDFFQANKGKLTIITSNHGCEFIHAYERLIAGHSFDTHGVITDLQKTSFFGLKLLLVHEIIKPHDLIQLINRSYKPALKLLDYSLSESGISLFSHAPIRFDHIGLLAKSLNVNYSDGTKEALAETIERVNQAFQSFAERNSITSLFHNNSNFDVTNMSEEDRIAWPVIYSIWNRWDEKKETESARPSRKNGYDIFYVHGHDMFQSLLAHVVNLDTLSGKGSRKSDLELINNAFQVILENKHKAFDQTAQDYILRNINRYKALNTDEYQLGALKTAEVLSKNINLSAIALSVLGGPMPQTLKQMGDTDVKQTNSLSVYEGIESTLTQGFYKLNV